MTDEAPRASGQCHCGEIRYSMSTAVQHHALCHCSDCRRHSGAPLVGWALVGNDEIEISGTAKIYASSEHGRRHFCGTCGTGLFYTNEAIFPWRTITSAREGMTTTYWPRLPKPPKASAGTPSDLSSSQKPAP